MAAGRTALGVAPTERTFPLVNDTTDPGLTRRPAGGGLTRRAFAAGGAGLAALGATALGGRPSRALAQAPPSAAATPTGNPVGAVTPERVALAVAQAPTIAQDILQRTGVPGMAVAIVFQDTAVFLDGFGTREIGKDEPIEPDTVFQLASDSKPIASTVVSAVVGDGTVAWDTRMSDVDPGFALSEAWPTEAVTLADLFAHRSGLPDHGGDLLEDLGFERDVILQRLRFLPPAYSFRAGYAYTNFGLTAAAVAAAHAAGKSWEDLSAERLYRPLGMTHTSSRYADFLAEANRAIPHVKQGDRWIVTPQPRDPDAQSPAGGVSSTVRDLVPWLRLELGQGALGGKQLIPAAALAPTHVPQSVRGEPADPATERTPFYGLGWDLVYTDFGTPQWSHSGAFRLGAATALYLLPAAGFGVIALANAYPVGAPEAFCLSMLDLAQRGTIRRDWLDVVAPAFAAMSAPAYGTGIDWSAAPANVASPLPDDAYVGAYRNAYYGDAAIVRAGDGLALQLGPKPLVFPLRHFDRDTFSWQPSGESASVRSGLSFTIGSEGRAVSFQDEYLASGGPGVLTRVP